MRNEIVMIGPMGVGKTTVSKRLSEKLNIKHIHFDEIRYEYYKEIGYCKETSQKLRSEKGFFRGDYHYLKPFAFYAVKKILNTFSNCVFDFGAYCSVYEDEVMFSEIREVLSDFKNVILLLPSENREESIEILTKIYKPEAENDPDSVDFITHTIEQRSNYDLAKHIVYVKDKSPDEIADEILGYISMKG